MSVESRFPDYESLADKDGYMAVRVSVRGKSTWTDPVISDMLDAAALRKDPHISHVDSDLAVSVETEEVDGKAATTGFSVWTRTYYVHPNPPTLKA